MNETETNPNNVTNSDNSNAQSSAKSILDDEKTLSILAHILGLPTQFIAPLVIWLIKRDQSSFISKHALEALNFQISLIIYGIVAGILSVILIGILAFPVLFIIDIVFCIQGALAASRGEEYKYPLSIRFIK